MKKYYELKSLRITLDKHTGKSYYGKKFLSVKENIKFKFYARFRYLIRVLLAKIFCKNYKVVLIENDRENQNYGYVVCSKQNY